MAHLWAGTWTVLLSSQSKETPLKSRTFTVSCESPLPTELIVCHLSFLLSNSLFHSATAIEKPQKQLKTAKSTYKLQHSWHTHTPPNTGSSKEQLSMTVSLHLTFFACKTDCEKKQHPLLPTAHAHMNEFKQHYNKKTMIKCQQEILTRPCLCDE